MSCVRHSVEQGWKLFKYVLNVSLRVSIQNGQYWAPVTDIGQTLVYTHLHPSIRVCTTHAQQSLPTFPFLCYRCTAGKKSIARRRQNTLSQNHESVSFCNARLWTLEWNKDFSWWLHLVEKDGPLRKDNFTNLLHPTLQTKSSFFLY